MKINEFKAKPKKKMNEVSVGWSALKGILSGHGSQQQLTQDVFIDDFIKDALISIKNGISGGIIDLSTGTTAKNPSDQKNNFAAPPSGGVNKGGATKQPAKTSPGTIAGKGNNFTAGPSPKVNFKESRYDKLNVIFESIILGEEDTTTTPPAASPTTPKDRSLQAYLRTWYNGWMRGINWKVEEDHVNSLIQNVADTYSKDRGKAALTQLAKASFAIAKANKGVPYGADNAVSKAGGGGVPGSEKRTPEQIKADIEALNKLNPTATTALVTDLLKTYVSGAKPR